MESGSVLKVCLFTDLVGSTDLKRLGDPMAHRANALPLYDAWVYAIKSRMTRRIRAMMQELLDGPD